MFDLVLRYAEALAWARVCEITQLKRGWNMSRGWDLSSMDMGKMMVRCMIGSRGDCYIVEEDSILFQIHRISFSASRDTNLSVSYQKHGRKNANRIPDKACCPVGFTPFMAFTQCPVLHESHTDDQYCILSASAMSKSTASFFSRPNHSLFRISTTPDSLSSTEDTKTRSSYSQ